MGQPTPHTNNEPVVTDFQDKTITTTSPISISNVTTDAEQPVSNGSNGIAETQVVETKNVESNVRIDAIGSNGTHLVDVVISNSVQETCEEIKLPDLLDLAPPETNNDMMTGISNRLTILLYPTLFGF